MFRISDRLHHVVLDQQLATSWCSSSSSATSQHSATLGGGAAAAGAAAAAPAPAAALGAHLPAPGDQLAGFEHAWSCHLLVGGAEAAGLTAVPAAAPACSLGWQRWRRLLRSVLERVRGWPPVVRLVYGWPVLQLAAPTWPFQGARQSWLEHDMYMLVHRLFMDFFDRHFQPSCSGALQYIFDFDPSPLCSQLPGARALHAGDSRPREVDAGDLPPRTAGAADHRCEQLPGYPPAPRPVASGCASPSAQQRRQTPRPPRLGSRDRRALQEERRLAGLAAAARRAGAPRQQGLDEPMPYDAALFALDAELFGGWAAARMVVFPGASLGMSLREFVLEYPGEAAWHLRDDYEGDTRLGFSYLIARWLSPRCLGRLGQVCVAWYDMCGGLGDDHFHARLASLFERITRPDWCAAGLCHHGECVLLRGAARATPSRAGGVRDYEPRDYGPREPGHGEMTQAFFDARYCGEDADFGDLAYDLSLHRG